MKESLAIEELGRLLSRMLESGLAPEGMERLEELLADDPEARRFYHSFLDLHVDLQWMLSPEALQLPSGLESLTTVDNDAGLRPSTRRGWLRPLVSGLGIAALIAVAFTWFYRSPVSTGTVQDLPPLFVVRISLDDNADWEPHSSIPRDDQWLGEGKVRLSSGTLGLTFATGARLIMSGPAELDINGPDRAYLHSGKITAQVPPQAIGFLLSTPDGNILDLGTEFSVDVGPERSRVEVTDGMVKAYAAGPSGAQVEKLIRQDEAVALAQDPDTPIAPLGQISGGTKTDWSLLQVPEFRSVHYRFDESDSPYASSGNRSRSFPGTAGNHWDEDGLPVSIAGRFGNALSFAGDGGCVTTPFPGIGSGRPRTVAFWIKLPPNVRGRSGQALVSWGAALPGERWQVGWNNNHGWGAIGAVRTDFFGGFVTGTTDLRDGRWHHVTSVFIGGRKPDVASHVLHYVDGRLEGVSGRKSKRIDTKVKQPESSTLLIGAQVNDGNDPVAFVGAIDELHIFDAALLPEQIVLLKQSNQPLVAAP